MRTVIPNRPNVFLSLGGKPHFQEMHRRGVLLPAAAAALTMLGPAERPARAFGDAPDDWFGYYSNLAFFFGWKVWKVKRDFATKRKHSKVKVDDIFSFSVF